MSALDRRRLLAWLELRSQSAGLVTHAIYKGLIARIGRGDFDAEATR